MSTLASYLLVVDADALAAQLPGLPSYNAAEDDDKLKSLALASARFDSAYRFQGRKFLNDGTQPLEFPRVAYDSGLAGVYASVPQTFNPAASFTPDQIWDWDNVNQAAIVPQGVLLAVLYEADSLIAGDRSERINAEHDGVQEQSIDRVFEIYRPPTDANGVPVLCRDADVIARKYRLRQGRAR